MFIEKCQGIFSCFVLRHVDPDLSQVVTRHFVLFTSICFQLLVMWAETISNIRVN